MAIKEVVESTTTRVRAVESAISRGRGFDYESGEKSKRIDAVESAVSNNKITRETSDEE